MEKSATIFCYNPPKGKKWVNISVCGLVGCISGMNEDGVTVMMHDSDGLARTDQTGFVPRGIALRMIMEPIGLF